MFMLYRFLPGPTDTLYPGRSLLKHKTYDRFLEILNDCIQNTTAVYNIAT